MKSPITVTVLGAGGRGFGFGQIIKELQHLGKIVGVAEPRGEHRRMFAADHHLPKNRVFKDWQEFIDRPKMCDAVVISTMDREHVGPALACLKKGYHVLIEKPMATSLADCQAIEQAQRQSGKFVAVCHSLRYSKGFYKVRELIRSGRIGRIITLDQLEQVAFWHYAHSFVRGNWGNEGRATFMLMSKSCHDIDLIAYLVDRPCLQVSSFGALTHFTRANAPKGSTARCTDGCPVEPTCPYSAIKQYVNCNDYTSILADAISTVHTQAARLEAIRQGPYGRCVYRADNDVVDHQVVAMEFADDITATFTMTAFTQGGGRVLRVHGTEGEIAYSGPLITVKTFVDNNVDEIHLGAETGVPGRHDGDPWVVRSWLHAIHQNNAALILTNAQESLRTHTIVFAAEKARREKRMVALTELNCKQSQDPQKQTGQRIS